MEGGEDLFILGKNFLKDAVVIFQRRGAKAHAIWEEKVLPDKDSLQPVSKTPYSNFEYFHIGYWFSQSHIYSIVLQESIHSL